MKLRPGTRCGGTRHPSSCYRDLRLFGTPNFDEGWCDQFDYQWKSATTTLDICWLCNQQDIHGGMGPHAWFIQIIDFQINDPDHWFSNQRWDQSWVCEKFNGWMHIVWERWAAEISYSTTTTRRGAQACHQGRPPITLIDFNGKSLYITIKV